MYNLVIDLGNSACKWAFFRAEKDQEEPLEVIHTTSGERLPEAVLNRYRPEKCLYSSVGRPDTELERWLRERIPQFLVYTREMPVPVRIAYRTPRTLGLDRVAAAVGAWTLAPGKASLIVDMGTAITYDYLSEDGVYRGGNIAPGIWLRFKALHENTAALPMVEAREDFPSMGTDTETAIRAGVMQGIRYELEGYRRQYARPDRPLLTFLTGGDTIYFDKTSENGIFARPNLVLTGLNRILYDNTENK